MIDPVQFAAALHLLFHSWTPWLVLIPGMIIGLLFHAIPGLTISMAVAIFLPVTAYMDFLSALIFMTAIYTGGLFGCAIPAILLNIPGAASAVATTFDGFPMAQKGQHDEALGYALAASTFGQALGYVILLFLVDPIAGVAIKLGPPEMFIIAIWGLTLIAGLRGGSFTRGLLAGAFGLLVGTIGMSARGTIRGTMGIDALLDGVPVVPALIGLFAAAELFKLTRADYIVTDVGSRSVSMAKIWHGFWRTFTYPVVLLRGSLLGTAIGTVPGGHAVANLLSYSEAKRTSKDPQSFGKGDPRGVIAAESGNASSEGGSMATLLALGIPTGGTTAIMLTAFSMHNIIGGPQFMHDHKDLVYAVILSNLAQVAFLTVFGLGFIFVAAYVIKVPLRVLIPLVLAMSVLGSYTLSGNMTGPITLFVFAVIGWLMQRYGYPVAATVVGLLLAHLTENSLLNSYQMSGGELSFFLGRPIALVLALFLVVSFTIPFVKRRFANGRLARLAQGSGTPES